MTPEEYLKLGQYIWSRDVPRSGQSLTVQGELLRASEKLRDEAQRNGNANWDHGHVVLATYILDTLLADGTVPEAVKSRLRTDIARITRFDEPYVEDDLWDRIARVILDWCERHPEPVARAIDPRLHR